MLPAFVLTLTCDSKRQWGWCKLPCKGCWVREGRRWCKPVLNPALEQDPDIRKCLASPGRGRGVPGLEEAQLCAIHAKCVTVMCAPLSLACVCAASWTQHESVRAAKSLLPPAEGCLWRSIVAEAWRFGRSLAAERRVLLTGPRTCSLRCGCQGAARLKLYVGRWSVSKSRSLYTYGETRRWTTQQPVQPEMPLIQVDFTYVLVNPHVVFDSTSVGQTEIFVGPSAVRLQAVIVVFLREVHRWTNMQHPVQPEVSMIELGITF